ncbi:MAG: hypothetical protein ACRDSZ_23275 [Pseudonocardiaceae bacterium]
MVQEEKLVTPFGTVTPGRVICCVGRGWLSGGSRQDVPLCCVTGVALQTRRHPVAGILLLLVALVSLATDPVGILVAVVPLALAVLFLWGSPSVRVSTVDGDLPPVSGWPWAHPEAQWFAAAVERGRYRCAGGRCPECGGGDAR